VIERASTLRSLRSRLASVPIMRESPY
jgi:hypothetical protein